ncbi:MAG: restriction endonuclease subunit S [Bacteroidetes bacterium]|nr:restriction endonuclease subunit S [Bacteroidota bacterium]
MSEWKEYKLGDVAEVKYGKAHQPLADGKIPAYGSGGLMRYVERALYEDESILIPRKGTLNNVMYKSEPFWTVDTMFYTRLNKQIIVPKYLFYQLSTIDFANMNVGSAVPSMTVPVLNDIDITVPPLPEQTAIASVLSSLDNKIDLLHRQNATLEKMAETLFRQWFVEEAKEEWENGKLGDIAAVQNGFAFKSKEFKTNGTNRVIKIKNISGGIIDIENTDYIENDVAEKTQERFKIITGDILIAMTGAEIGKLGIVPKTIQNLWLNQRVGLLKEKYKGSKYLAYLQLKSEFGQDYIENTATGSAQPNISGNAIENCEFPKITEEKIKKYSLQIGELYDKVIFNLGQIRTLTALRDTLLPKLMSGEIRVEM